MLLRCMDVTRYVLQAALQVCGPRLVTLRRWATAGFVGLGKRRLAASPYLNRQAKAAHSRSYPQDPPPVVPSLQCPDLTNADVGKHRMKWQESPKRGLSWLA